jgi:quercetin dioxygenase-like cupin family protein
MDNQQALRDLLGDRRIAHCGIAEFPPDTVAHEGEKHVHEHDEIFIILAGQITVPVTDGPTEIAHAGDWVLVEAGEEHHLTNHTNLPCVAMYLIVRQ